MLNRYVNPILGNKKIDEIKRSDVRDLLLKHFKAGLSRSTVALIRDVCSGVLGHAVDDELIPANPVTGITKKLQLDRDKKIEVEPLTVDETNLFLEACRKHESKHYPLFLTGFRTGLRLGELISLQWTDIDWNSRFIKVQRSYKNRHMDKTKTGKVRRVDMSDQVIETLEALQTERKKEALRSGRGEMVTFIFHRDGVPIAQNSVRNIFKRILKKAGLREIRVHDMRHTFASQLLSQGASLMYVKEMCGHSSIQITCDIYGHLIPGSNRDQINQLDAPMGTLSAPGKIKKAVSV